LTPGTWRAVADARAAVAALDSTARRLPNPRLLRQPSLRAEAQSTSALEGTYAPLEAVLTADEERPGTIDLREVLNYVAMADLAFEAIESGQSVTVGLLGHLQGQLVRGTRSEGVLSGSVRTQQVVIGHRPDAPDDELPIRAAQFVPPPPGFDLEARLRDLLAWMQRDQTREFDPVVAAAMAHYQFEALHPFHDGNGRIGRLLIVVHLYLQGALIEPTLTVSPWFEARRGAYYDHLLAVSTQGAWDPFVRFFATGLEASARRTHEQMLALVELQRTFKERVRRSALRADTAQVLVDYAVGHPTFTVRAVERDLAVSYGRANTLVGQLVQLGILAEVPDGAGTRRRFYAPEVLAVITSRGSASAGGGE
jgi:Fic family protein